MPGLNVGLSDTTLTATPLEAAVPARSRRRVWTHPELASHSLLVLTLDRIYLAPLVGDPKPEVVAAVEAGADLDDVLGPLAVVIRFVSIRRLDLDLLTNSLTIEYAAVGERASRQRLTFATPEAADACFTKIWRRLGKSFQLAPYRQDTWTAARAPLLMLLATLAATAVFALILSLLKDSEPDRVGYAGAPGAAHYSARAESVRPLERMFGWLDWRVVCGVGGVVAAVSQVWLYRRLTTPPLNLKLVRNT